MKKLPYLFIVSLITLTYSCSNAPDSDKAKTTEAQEVIVNTDGDRFIIDPQTSKMEWIGTKVSGHHSGPIMIKSGELLVSNGNISGGNFILDMTSISTMGPEGSDADGNAKLTGHLKSGDFFDVEKYPEAKFTITEVKPFTGKVNDPDDARQADINEYRVTNPTHMVSGNLTIKDVSKNIEFPAKIIMSDNAVEATAKFNIDRSKWNIVYPGKPDDLIRNDIHLGIALKATK